MSEDLVNGEVSQKEVEQHSFIKPSTQTSHVEEMMRCNGEPNRAPQPPNELKRSSSLIQDTCESTYQCKKVENRENSMKPSHADSTNPAESSSVGRGAKFDVSPQAAQAQDQTKKKRSTKPKKSKANLRRGKWTVEEEEYTTKIIQHFRTGLLSLPNGHTLRSYLAEKLNCDPMRITKKFSGASCLGKRVYNLCDRSQVSAHDLELANAELMALEQRYRMRIEHGSSLPLASHLSAFRKMGIPGHNSLDQSKIVSPNYLFMQNTANVATHTGQPSLASANAASNIGVSPNFGHQNLPLAIIQSLAAQRQSDRNSQFQNQLTHSYQLQNQLQSQQMQHQVGSNVAHLLSIQQTLNPNLLTNLINGQVALHPSPAPVNDSAHTHALSQQQPFFNPIQNSSMLHIPHQSQDQNAYGGNQISSILQQQAQPQQQPSDLASKNTNEVAIEALAATYNRAAAMSSNTSLQHAPLEKKHEEAMIQVTAPTLNTNISKNTSIVKKVRTQEEEDAGRTLLFIRELQSNHRKAISVDTVVTSTTTSSIQNQTNSSKDDSVTIRSTSTPNSSLSEKLLKRGFDISLDNTTGLATSTVPNSEALSGSSNAGGSTSESSSSDGNQDQCGSDTEKEVESAGPLRKRFRRSGSAN